MGMFVVLFACVLLSTCHGVMAGRVTWSDMTIVPITMSTSIDNTSGLTTGLSTDAPVMSSDNKTVTTEDVSLLTTVFNGNETGTDGNATANVHLGKAAWKKTILYVSYVTVPILVVTGVCGNMFTIRVMLAKNFQRMSVSAFLIAMALSDTAVIIVSTLNKSWIRNLIGTDYRAFNQAGCIAFFWAFRTSKLVSSWIVVLICIERFIAVCIPLRSKTLCSKRMAYASIVTTVLGASVFSAFRGWMDTSIVNGTCLPNSRHLKEYIAIVRMLLLVSLVIYALIPAIVTLVLNAFTVTSIWKGRRKVHVMTTTHNPAGKTATQSTKATTMLLSTNVAFIVCVTPISIVHAVSFSRRVNLFESSDPMVVAVRETAQVFEQLNYSINFFLYVLCNSRFRSEFMRTVLCCVKVPVPALEKSTFSPNA